MKQETIEEAAFKYTRGKPFKEMPSQMDFINGAVFGAKWQQEQMYSKEEVIQLLIKFNQEIQEVEDVRIWFEQFKKK